MSKNGTGTLAALTEERATLRARKLEIDEALAGPMKPKHHPFDSGTEARAERRAQRITGEQLVAERGQVDARLDEVSAELGRAARQQLHEHYGPRFAALEEELREADVEVCNLTRALHDAFMRRQGVAERVLPLAQELDREKARWRIPTADEPRAPSVRPPFGSGAKLAQLARNAVQDMAAAARERPVVRVRMPPLRRGVKVHGPEAVVAHSEERATSGGGGVVNALLGMGRARR